MCDLDELECVMILDVIITCTCICVNLDACVRRLVKDVQPAPKSKSRWPLKRRTNS